MPALQTTDSRARGEVALDPVSQESTWTAACVTESSLVTSRGTGIIRSLFLVSWRSDSWPPSVRQPAKTVYPRSCSMRAAVWPNPVSHPEMKTPSDALCAFGSSSGPREGGEQTGEEAEDGPVDALNDLTRHRRLYELIERVERAAGRLTARTAGGCRRRHRA
eukprot:scaffold18285_cov35-Tisochrysis_lutea.AAC.3